jgi:hypothetical protein
MRLPDDSIGISDLNDYLACPRRVGFKLRRFTEGKEPPEARGKAGVRDPTSAYGSAIHDAIFLIEEEAYRPDEAAEAAFQKWAQWLEPSDLKHLEDDLATYLRRDVRGVETVVNEGEFKVPLLQFEGRTIYFRFKVDRLYRRLDAPTQFVHIDYKSSKWLKSKQEVHDDRQLWATSFSAGRRRLGRTRRTARRSSGGSSRSRSRRSATTSSNRRGMTSARGARS